MGDGVISILCPTRGRPHGVQRLFDSALATAKEPFEFVFYTDDDDPNAIPDEIARFPSVQVLSGPRLVLSDYWNACARAANGDILGMLGDDVEFQSRHWDVLLEAEFAKYQDRILFAFGWDGFRNETHGSHGFVSRQWVDALGYFTTPDFSHDYADTWMNDVARAVGRWRYVEGLVTRHFHPDDPSLGVVVDATYVEGRERGARDNPSAMYESVEMRARRELDAEKLRAVMSS